MFEKELEVIETTLDERLSKVEAMITMVSSLEDGARIRLTIRDGSQEISEEISVAETIGNKDLVQLLNYICNGRAKARDKGLSATKSIRSIG